MSILEDIFSGVVNKLCVPTTTIVATEPHDGWLELVPHDYRLRQQKFGKTTFFRCTHKDCGFQNNRKCHALSHHDRIHIKKGIPMLKKRKFEFTTGTSAPQIRKKPFAAVICEEFKKPVKKAVSHSKSTVIKVDISTSNKGISKTCRKRNPIAKKQDKHVKFFAEMSDNHVNFVAGMKDTKTYFAGKKNEKRNLVFGDFNIIWGSGNDTDVDFHRSEVFF